MELPVLLTEWYRSYYLEVFVPGEAWPGKRDVRLSYWVAAFRFPGDWLPSGKFRRDQLTLFETNKGWTGQIYPVYSQTLDEEFASRDAGFEEEKQEAWRLSDLQEHFTLRMGARRVPFSLEHCQPPRTPLFERVRSPLEVQVPQTKEVVPW